MSISTYDYYQIPADISAIYLDNTYAQISFTTPSTVVNPNYYYHVVVYDASGNYYDASGTSSPITVNGLTLGTTYSCYVELIQYSTSSILVKRTLPWPKIYSIYISDVSYSSLKVNWTGVDISYLTVSRRIGSAAATAQDISTSTTYYTTYGDGDVSGNTVYYYYVTPFLPYNGVVNTGTASAVVSTTTLPAPPTDVSATFCDNSAATVSFTAARNSYSSSYYYILRATSTTGYIDASGTASPIQVSELSGNTSYRLRVISAIDNSAALYATSTSAAVRTTTVRPPKDISVAYDSSAITVSYSAGKNTYSTIYYTLYASGAAYATNVSGSTTALSITGLSGNTSYSLSVANTLNGNTALSATTVYGSQLTLTQPPKSIYKTYVDSSALTVGFTAGANTYSSIVYTATATDGAGTTRSNTTTEVAPFTVMDLSGNTKYTFIVRTTLDGNAALTASSYSLSQRTYVQSPTDVSTVATDGSSVAITFSYPKNSYETGVYYVASITDGINATDTSGTTNVLLIQGLSASTNYSYYVKTVLTARTSTNTVSTYNPYPTITQITARDVSYNFVNVNWVGTDISYVRVSRRVGARGASYTDISLDYVTPYNDKDISGNTAYYYYITPIRIYKGVTKIGSASSVISATTLVAPPTDVSVAFYDYSGALIKFTAPRNSYSSSYYYTVRASDSSGNYRDVSGMASPIHISNLSSLTTYSFYVRVTIDGSASLVASSSSVSATTTYNYAYFNGLIFGVTRFS